jgi:hypothetical protein
MSTLTDPRGQISAMADTVKSALAADAGVGFKLVFQLPKNAHAIGLYSKTPNYYYIFDPNYGLYKYTDLDKLGSDIWGLFSGQTKTYNFAAGTEWMLRSLEKLTA